jgi:hypothetical protein
MSDPRDDDWYDDDLPDDDLDLHEADCGLTPDGLCQNAGTEWCDWSCPLNGDRNANRIRKMKRKNQSELDL